MPSPAGDFLVPSDPNQLYEAVTQGIYIADDAVYAMDSYGVYTVKGGMKDLLYEGRMSNYEKCLCLVEDKLYAVTENGQILQIDVHTRKAAALPALDLPRYQLLGIRGSRFYLQTEGSDQENSSEVLVFDSSTETLTSLGFCSSAYFGNNWLTLYADSHDGLWNKTFYSENDALLFEAKNIITDLRQNDTIFYLAQESTGAVLHKFSQGQDTVMYTLPHAPGQRYQFHVDSDGSETIMQFRLDDNTHSTIPLAFYDFETGAQVPFPQELPQNAPKTTSYNPARLGEKFQRSEVLHDAKTDQHYIYSFIENHVGSAETWSTVIELYRWDGEAEPELVTSYTTEGSFGYFIRVHGNIAYLYDHAYDPETQSFDSNTLHIIPLSR